MKGASVCSGGHLEFQRIRRGVRVRLFKEFVCEIQLEDNIIIMFAIPQSGRISFDV